MNRLMLLAVLVVADCSCSQAPIKQNSQDAIVALQAGFDLALEKEAAYVKRPDCDVTTIRPCADDKLAYSAQRAKFSASAALDNAKKDRTEAAITTARAKVDVFVVAAARLK